MVVARKNSHATEIIDIIAQACQNLKHDKETTKTSLSYIVNI